MEDGPFVSRHPTATLRRQSGDKAKHMTGPSQIISTCPHATTWWLIIR